MDQTEIIFVAAAGACFAIAAVALKTGRVLGLAFRGRLVARRQQEPILYWGSLAMLTAFGSFLTYAVVAVRFF